MGHFGVDDNEAIFASPEWTSIKMPDSVTSIGSGAFCNCSGLTNIEIPAGVTSIGDWAFYGCSSLTSIKIPDSVTSIGYRAFERCSSLTSIIVDVNNGVYDSRDNCNAIIKTDTKELLVGCRNTEIPASVTSIGSGAFRNCSGLTNIEIPAGVTSIGYYAFENCRGLTSIEIPASVTEIDYDAFSGCSSLTDVYYTGSEADWAKISISSNNTPLTNATIHYNYNSETTE